MLEDLQHASDRSLQREVLRNELLIKLVVLLFHQAIVIAMVPQEVAAIELLATRLDIRLLDLLQHLDLVQTALSQALSQVTQEVIHSL